MRNKLRYTALAFFLGYAVMGSAQEKNAADKKEIVLIGASIGEAWNLPAFPQRMGISGYSFDYKGVYDFNKRKLIDEVLGKKSKPDYVMIKECSTYFPRDPASYKKDIPAWVEQLRAAGVKPILVTAAPVGEDWITKTKNIVKAAIGRPTWLESIAAYNDWIKAYGAQQKIPVFDLEAVLRESDAHRELKKEYDRGDLVHLTPAAYKEVDKAFAQFLRQLDS